MNVQKRWRLVLLAALVVLSGVAIFVPGIGAGGGTIPAADSPTNVEFGLQLSGGTRLRAPVVGVTAEDVDVTTDNELHVERTVAAELGVQQLDVQARPGPDTVEVYANVSEANFTDALSAANVSAGNVRPGVTAATRETVVETIQSKIDAAGLSGSSVTQTETATGAHYVIIEVPNQNASSVRTLLAERGRVTLTASFPEQNGTGVREEVVLTQEDLAGVSAPTTQQGRVVVPVAVKEDAARRFARSMQQYGFTSGRGIGNCRYDTSPNSSYCLLTVRDGDVVYEASMGDGLARQITGGTFVQQGTFVITAPNVSEARALQINLQAGALPAPLDLEGRGTAYFLAPSLAEQFKLYSLLTGIIAVFAVSGVVFLRYGRAEVAAPMVVTALSEVVILLGFAATIGLPLDLSHIAGFIAVIGTGVDDLIIIADEVMAKEVSSGRVFQSRFRKALWIIGAAAVTTIIAMSPLAVLSLGDLRGFAIITILGVLVGVLITRPAYGDILRALLTDR